ncbi:endo-1,4-beta-xylanase [Pedobacter sp. SYSU D00535]|uniref:endo-1,4-beta-xylanase n=1 Tax=Pedobacter sp. SYSU D00535 TaxID=2810308 RepID=UPI001A95E35D|nr:endo-1,4-beta-xylanase [Pedobacter sp. SYSU D00535]
MKKSHKLLGIYAFAFSALVACDPREESDFFVDKPQSLIVQEELDSFDALKSYINRGTHAQFKLGASVAATDYITRGILYRIVNRNFDEINPTGLTHGSIVRADGSPDLTALSGLISTAKASEVSVFGPALVSHTNQNSTYLNSIIAPLVISGDAARAVVVNFDADNLGTTYPMSNGGSATVVNNTLKNSKVLNVKGAQTFPRLPITLPQGRKLGDYVSITLDMYITDATGRFGQGMRVSINGGTVVNYPTPANSGISNGVWGKMTLPLATMNLTEQQKQLTTFTLMVGSATGAADYFIDNISMQDINIPKTNAEKTQLIDAALSKYISSVVDTSKHYIKAWTVIDRPMDDVNPSQLRTGVGKTLSAGDFYWRDYLGNDFGVRAFQLARQRANSGDKLFVNEDKLLGNSAKLNGLLAYINDLGNKGATVDGIGVDLNLTLNSNKAEIDQLFTSLAATGKLIRVSGLTIGTAGVKKKDATAETYNQQAEMYKYVIQKYLELIPAAQRYGIVIRDLVDASGAEVEPLGLFRDNYLRKPAYVGVTEGLAGK